MPITAHGAQCTHRDPDTGERCIPRLCAANEGPDCFVHRPQTRTAHRQLVGNLDRQRALRELRVLMAQDDQRIAA